MLLTLGLVRLIGARRTRIVAQVLGAFAGAAIFILSQLFAQFSSSMETRALAAFARAFGSDGALGAASPVWLPGRALLGEPLPVLGVVAVAVAAFVFTAGRTHRFFVQGLQQAASSGRTAPRPVGGPRVRFGRSLFASVLFKEWRLIVRDPHLISQVALQLVYLLPLFFIIFRRGEFQMPAMAAGLTLLCSSITAALAWIVVSAEDAPDLLRLSPAPASTLRRAKLAAAILPSLALVALPLAWLVLRMPGAGMLAALSVCGAVGAAALIVHWCGRPGLRSDYLARGKSDVLTSILEMFNSLSWGALAWCLASLATKPSDKLIVGTWCAALAVLVTLGVSRLLRRPRA
jgi:ABC-2 type transport system permease protein